MVMRHSKTGVKGKGGGGKGVGDDGGASGLVSPCVILVSQCLTICVLPTLENQLQRSSASLPWLFSDVRNGDALEHCQDNQGFPLKGVQWSGQYRHVILICLCLTVLHVL